MTPRRSWILAILYMAGLFALSSVPDDPKKPGLGAYFPPPQLQNALHVPAYAGLSFLMWRGLRGPKKTLAQRHAPLLAAALATVYGALDEVHQMFVVGRTPSVTDALANALGAFAVAGCVLLLSRRAPGPPTLPS
ncbi:MAG TPA: VanZ family protein [Planctomycetota bacterium]|nr:VanZ family protein [Planctomycetota bacterium]